MGVIQNVIGRLSQKNIGYVPALPPLGIFNGNARLIDYKSKHEQIQANMGWVYTANNVIAEACADVPLHLYKVNKNGEDERIFEHEIIDLLDRPNNYITGHQMNQLYYSYMNLVGESYEYLIDDGKISRRKLPLAIHILPAHMVQFSIGKNGVSIKYNNQDYDPESIVRDLRPDPRNPYRGLGIVEASAASIDTDNQATKFNRSFFANAARPSLVFEVDQELGEKGAKRLKQEIQDLNSGAENAGRPIVAENAKVKNIMISQREMDYLASRKFTKDEILAMFRVSPAVLGMVENVNKANMEAAELYFAKYIIAPRVNQRAQTLNATLVRPYDATLELRPAQIIPEDMEAKLNLFDKGVDKFITIDEARKQYGYAPLPDNKGDTLYRPATEVAIGESNFYAASLRLGNQKKKSLKHPKH